MLFLLTAHRARVDHGRNGAELPSAEPAPGGRESHVVCGVLHWVGDDSAVEAESAQVAAGVEDHLAWRKKKKSSTCSPSNVDDKFFLTS